MDMVDIMEEATMVVVIMIMDSVHLQLFTDLVIHEEEEQLFQEQEAGQVTRMMTTRAVM
jgi:hypothetical protein